MADLVCGARWTKPHESQMELGADGWRTPDTYSAHYEPLTDEAAVYLFRAFDQVWFDRAFIAYVGMATNLQNRLSGHEVLSKVRRAGFYVQRWFKPVPTAELRSTERKIIEKYDPPWNLIGRRRGVAA